MDQLHECRPLRSDRVLGPRALAGEGEGKYLQGLTGTT